jgi:hypothetical protein
MCLTKHPHIFQELSDPFTAEQVKTRPGGGGRQLRYITARQAMNRLDSVLGPENWWDEYVVVGDVLYCKLTIRLPDGFTVTKWGAGGFKTMTEKTGEVDQENTDKTGESDAFKRAAVKFGVGRDLYGDGIPDFLPPKPATNGHAKAVTFDAWLAARAKDFGVSAHDLRCELFDLAVAEKWTTHELAGEMWQSLFDATFESHRDVYREWAKSKAVPA